MTEGSTYVERAPARGLAALASSVWVQEVGDRPLVQRHVPHGGASVFCVLGQEPRLLGPLTTATHEDLPAGATVVGVRLRPGAVGGLVGMPASELVDRDLAGADLWRDLNRLTDGLGRAPTPQVALARLESFLARMAGEPDPLVTEAVRILLPQHGGRTAGLPDLLSISERQLRRRCRAAVGVGPKELHRILRFQGFVARLQSAADRHQRPDLAGWAVGSGYHDQAHLTRECRRLIGVPPGEYLAQTRSACTSGHDHAASYLPVLAGGHGRSVQEGRSGPA